MEINGEVAPEGLGSHFHLAACRSWSETGQQETKRSMVVAALLLLLLSVPPCNLAVQAGKGLGVSSPLSSQAPCGAVLEGQSVCLGTALSDTRVRMKTCHELEITRL